MQYEESYREIERLKRQLDSCEAIIVGAGAGLSVSAGYTYFGPRFKEYFQDFIDRYGFTDMYSGGFYPFETLEEYWAYWSRYIFINRYMDAPKPVYARLMDILKDKDYFVLTTNVDHCFQKAGIDKKRLFYTQGDYGLWQCSVPCHAKTYDNEEAVRRMTKEQKDMRIPEELVPLCPVCGMPMTMNLRADDRFVEDEGWHDASRRCNAFLQEHKNGHLLLLELGCGMNTPGIIKFNFWQMTAKNPKAVYACINYKEAVCPQEIEKQSICINEDIGETILSIMTETAQDRGIGRKP